MNNEACVKYDVVASGAKSVVVNLCQNPRSRPICGKMLPTLLKNGIMWRISSLEQGTELNDRYMLGKVRGGTNMQSHCHCVFEPNGHAIMHLVFCFQEHLVSMAVPIYDFLVCKTDFHPHVSELPSDNQCKKLAGNVPWLEKNMQAPSIKQIPFISSVVRQCMVASWEAFTVFYFA